jgi:hypothetical protein
MTTQAVSGASLFQEMQSFYQTRKADLLGNATFASFKNELHNNHFPKPPVQGTDSPATTISFSNADSSAATTGTQATGSDSVNQKMHDFWKQRNDDLKQLGAALQSGDLTAAQAAFNALTALGQSGPFPGGETFHKADRAASFEAIGTALQAGDLAGAQASFATLEAEIQGNSHPIEPPIQPPTVAGPPMEPPTSPPTFWKNHGHTGPPMEPPNFARHHHFIEPPTSTNSSPVITYSAGGGSTINGVPATQAMEPPVYASSYNTSAANNSVLNQTA